MIAVNMTAYPSVRKPALEAPEPVDLEFARDRPIAVLKQPRAGLDKANVALGARVHAARRADSGSKFK
jgi:hypothetical protein